MDFWGGCFVVGGNKITPSPSVQCSLGLCYNDGQNIWEKLSFSCEIAHYGKISISLFQQFFGDIDKIFISGVRLGTTL